MDEVVCVRTRIQTLLTRPLGPQTSACNLPLGRVATIHSRRSHSQSVHVLSSDRAIGAQGEGDQQQLTELERRFMQVEDTLDRRFDDAESAMTNVMLSVSDHPAHTETA